MCVIILQPVGKLLYPSTLESCYNNNNDGAGIAYVDKDNKVQISKGIFGTKSLIANYEKLRDENKNTPMIIHCRIATQGRVNVENTHPFYTKAGAMAHNGTLWTGGNRNDERSDTREFAEELFNDLTAEAIKKNIIALGAAVKKRNKLVFLHEDKSYSIVNEDEGHWIDGCWFSNNYWRHTSNYGPYHYQRD